MSGEPLPGVDVVVVTYESADHLACCLEAVAGWARVETVTVVDNNSADTSVKVAGGRADRVVALPTNVGFGSGQNTGVALGAAPYVLLLNPDAVVDVDALELGARHLDGDAAVGAVQGAIIRAADGGIERSSGREPGLLDLLSRLLRLRQVLGERRLQLAARLVGARYFSDRVASVPVDAEFLACVAVLARRRSFADVGGFDPRYFLYAEDIDLSRRFRQAGWRLVALPGRWAVHAGGASSTGARRLQQQRWWRSHDLFVRTHWRGARRVAGLALGLMGRLLAGDSR